MAKLVLCLLACAIGAQSRDGVCLSSGEGCSDYKDPAEIEDMYKYMERDEYNPKGVEFARNGDPVRGLELFRAASYHTAHRQDVWGNIGLALRDVATRLPAAEQKKKLNLLRESRQAMELALWLGHQSAPADIRNLERLFRSEFPKKCFARDCQRYQLERKAIKALNDDENPQLAANILCSHPDNLTVTLDPNERSGPLFTESHHRLFLVMHICGVAVVKDVYPRALIDEIYKETEVHWNKWDEQLKSLSKGKDASMESTTGAEEYTDAASRSVDRYEVKFPLKEPYTDRRFVSNRILLSLLKPVIGGRFEIDTFSYVASRAGAPDQPWHADVPYLFPQNMKKTYDQVPSNGVVNIVPLIDLKKKHGPTEFACGSHWPGSGEWTIERMSNPDVPVHGLVAERGSSIVFDIRLYHRGTRNRSDRFRPIVYMSYVREWWFDRVNFKDKQTKDFDELTNSQKKLFLRLDAREYIKRLEDKLVQLGGDPEEIQSSGGYKKNDLAV